MLTRAAARVCWAVALLAGLAAAGEGPALPPPVARPVDFARDVRPIFENRCYSCHGPKRRRGGLRLDVKAAALKGGDTYGPAVVPGKGAESPLVRAVAGLDDDLVMPPTDDDRRTLSDEEIATLRAWVDQGAAWPDEAVSREDDPLNHWAFRPLERPPVPAEAGGARNPVDLFIKARLREARLTPAPEADGRTLVRRLTFDLTGLPPTPDEVEAFVCDPRPDAFERLADRLLASPAYGERMARLWLDVVHFGESNGFGMDRPRLTAWPYRDYLISAFNSDTKYARFVKEQIACDALYPNEPAKTPALGFAAAGPFNQSALAEQVDGTLCKRIALNLDRDDMVASVAATFLGLTVHCARCHDHKFDPIPQKDYYRLQAVFAGVGRAERAYDADSKVAAARHLLLAEKAALDKDPDTPPSSEQDRSRLAESRRRWEDEARAEPRGWTLLRPSVAATAHGVTLAVQPDGSLLATGPSPPVETYTLTLADVPPGATGLRLELLPDPSLPAKGPGRAENGNLHLTELKAFTVGADAVARPVALANPTADFNQADWEFSRALDGNPATGWGIHPAEGKSHAAVVEFARAWDPESGSALRLVLEQHHGRGHTIGRFRLWASTRPHPARLAALPADVLAALTAPPDRRTPAQNTTLARHFRRADLAERLAALPAPSRVYAIAADFPAFRNYKPTGGPVPIRVLKRGDVAQPGDPVGPGALGCVRGLPAEFALTDPNDEAARRAALANWVTDRANPLTWRVIANRVWQWHFGTGLVDTPNDLGRHGGKPSHPELLDWLAATLRDDGAGGSLKTLHRLIVTSSAYRRSSEASPSPDDTDNRLLARQNRRRLDAEQLRDALLAVAGRLDPAMGGPSVMQFNFRDPNKEVSPQIDYAGFDPDSPASRRRGVYRFLFRNVTDPLLEAFDAADPSFSTPRRNVTVTPQQALSLWNGRFALRQCEHLASRLEHERPDILSRLVLACVLAWGRPPNPGEIDLIRRHAEAHGLASACRVVLNANDFLFIH